MEKNFDKIVEQLLDVPHWVIDLLPMQVPMEGEGQFFAVEQYYMKMPQYESLCRRFADVLLKLNCYYDMLVNCAPFDEWVKNPEPATLVDWLMDSMKQGYLCILVENEKTLITASSDDTHLTLYNPSPELLELVGKLASAAGLFLWQPQEI